MRKIEATDAELQALGVILDTALKAAGLQLCRAAVNWQDKIEQSEEIKPKKKK